MRLLTSFCFRLITGGFLFVLLVFFVNPFFLGIRNIGNIAGTAFCSLGILFLLFVPKLTGVIQTVWNNTTGHFLLCVLIGAITGGLLLGLFITGCMLRAGLNAPKTEQTVVILGCQVRASGPSLMLTRRMDTAIRYLNVHPKVSVIVSGGQGEDEPMSEAQCMYDYLTAKGISPKRIIMESESASTKENLKNTLEILDSRELPHEITIVTDGYHQLRASMIASDLGIRTKALSAYTSWYLLPTYCLREWFGVCYQFVFG